MKITKEKIEKILNEAKGKGVDVRLRDIGYYALNKAFGNPELSYKMIFNQNGAMSDAVEYESGKPYLFVREWFGNSSSAESISTDLTFTENKQALIDMLNEITELAKSGEIPQKDAMKIKADIRVKLNDKFQVQESAGETIVVVPAKYDFICPHTSRECYQMTAEYAKKEFHLIDDPKYAK